MNRIMKGILVAGATAVAAGTAFYLGIEPFMASLTDAVAPGADQHAAYTQAQRFTLATWVAAGVGMWALREIFSQRPARRRR